VRIVHAIARLNVGGAALSVLELAAGQQARGHDVLVVAGRMPAGEASMEHVAEELGVSYFRLPSLQREVSPRADLASIASLRRLLVERRPDVLHTHTSKAGTTGRLAALAAARNRPATVVHTFHGHVLSGYFNPAKERGFRLVERTLAHASDALIAVSDEVRADLIRFRVAPAPKIRVIPYGFDLDARVQSHGGVRDGDAFVVGWAGRLTAVKRPLDLIRVAAAVPGCTLVLAGDGELRGETEQLARVLGVDDRVRFLGYVDDIGERYASFDAFLLTSLNEGAPVVAIEALAAGVPVVATDAGGTRTVVDDEETGYVVPIGDIDALANRLRFLRDDPALRARFGATGAERMRERFSIDRMVEAVDRLYVEVRRG
jgi:glycosyltransferase involved in cell wall biosynthesis